MAGGTGGHVFPALAIADELKALGESVVWMGTRSGLEAKVIPEAGYNIEWLSVNGLRGKGIITLLLAPFKLLQTLSQAARIIKKHQPKAVLGMGGFVSGPGGVMSWLMRVPLFIHEQNSVVGLTNQWLSRLSHNVFYGFKNPKKQVKSGVYVGNPVRKDLLSIAKKPRKDSYKLLILGGSLGAAQLNKTVPQALELLDDDRIQVIHQCGKRHLATTQQAYQNIKQKNEVKDFIEDMNEAYQWADFIVCRSGALTVSEVSQVGLPSLLVPYPYAVDNHQYFNALQLQQANAAEIVEDKQLKPELLAEKLKSLFLDDTQREVMANNAKAMAMPNATHQVVEGILRGAKQ